MRENLLESAMITLDKENNVYRFEENYIFTSPSYAAVVIAGGEENGRMLWKYNGKNLNRIEEEEIN